MSEEPKEDLDSKERMSELYKTIFGVPEDDRTRLIRGTPSPLPGSTNSEPNKNPG